MNSEDASALLALLLNESSVALAISAMEEGAWIISLNLAELAGRFSLS